MDFLKVIAAEIARNQSAMEEYGKLLVELPEGRLAMVKSKGRIYYLRINGKEKHYLGGENNNEVQQLKKRRLAETGIELAKRNIALLEAIRDGYERVDREHIMSILPKTYRICPSNRVPEAEKVWVDLWEQADYAKKENCEYDMPEHITVKGEKVRSKSEVNIANMLHEKGIPYRYEEELQLRNGKIVSPDFTIFVKNEGRTKLLEHCGAFYKNSYVEQYAWKVRNYIASGIIPNRDVFFTYEDMDGNIDTRAIDLMMEIHFK